MKYFSPPIDALTVEIDEYVNLPNLENEEWIDKPACQDLISFRNQSLAEVHQKLLRSGNKGYFPSNSETFKWRSKILTLIALGVNIEEQFVISPHPPYQTGILYTLQFSPIE
ncbi:hypothetical protein [Hirschia baltica]|uniref:Uncharacterized protein n=1 Tax=Hirschia baltica (strain ATCC 49814 / DSM 5838 / IFAM 1418) TaxID=582402 RepID=C6XR23_HIRBI|nr:hypothetical protein [Hirschia baltica]ACT60554.1 hypothetical protein Hbal_2882 [Hirschia baltica ATCC 49814]